MHTHLHVEDGTIVPGGRQASLLRQCLANTALRLVSAFVVGMTRLVTSCQTSHNPIDTQQTRPYVLRVIIDLQEILQLNLNETNKMHL